MRAGIFALLLALATTPAVAETILHLAETATMEVHPDELVCDIRAQATASQAAAAQASVNAAIADALARAKRVAAVQAATGAYSVWRGQVSNTDRTEKWQASQSIALRSHDPAALLTLVGELQGRGLAISALDWQLAPQTERQAQEQATAQALRTLRGRADQAAALLDLRFGEFRDVRLNGAGAPTRPMPRMMMQAPAAAAAPPPPSAEPEDVPISATAEADVLLKPK